jgi:hemerythrin-like domain-containing protein
MAVQIGARPDSGFDDPIGMLTDCHRRIERFLDILCRVAQKAQGRALNHDEQSAVETAIRYFDESGPRHNMDEEESLFPRLRDMKAATVIEELRQLESEHQEAAALHEEAARLYVTWIAEAGLSAREEIRLLTVTEHLQRLYQKHIQIEEDVVFPFASKLIDQKALAAMGSEFKARRELNRKSRTPPVAFPNRIAAGSLSLCATGDAPPSPHQSLKE